MSCTLSLPATLSSQRACSRATYISSFLQAPRLISHGNFVLLVMPLLGGGLPFAAPFQASDVRPNLRRACRWQRCRYLNPPLQHTHTHTHTINHTRICRVSLPYRHQVDPCELLSFCSQYAHHPNIIISIYRTRTYRCVYAAPQQLQAATPDPPDEGAVGGALPPVKTAIDAPVAPRPSAWYKWSKSSNVACGQW